MNILSSSLKSLSNSAHSYLKENQIDAAEDTIQTCSAIAAVSGVGAGWIPGAGGVIAAGAMTATVWTMYIKINKDLGISMEKNLLKFIASAFVTNLASNVGGIVAILAVTSLLSFIPGVGSVPAAIITGIMGYVITYASAILYINFLTKILNVKGSFNNIHDKDELKDIIDKVNDEADLKEIAKEAKDEYKKAKRNGDLDKAKSQNKH